jgi:hypothetical protein
MYVLIWHYTDVHVCVLYHQQQGVWLLGECRCTCPGRVCACCRFTHVPVRQSALCTGRGSSRHWGATWLLCHVV